MANSPTTKDVAAFMKESLESKKYLYQEEVVYEIQSKFGEDFVYVNDGGGLSIARKVLSQFRKLTPNAVWERGERCWRQREGYDNPKSRMQD